MKVEATTYDHSKPILQMFTHINEYNLMADHAHSAETPQQMINLGLIIITKSNVFASNIQKWHARPDADKTWQNFKTHFIEAQQAIRQSQPTITTDSLGYHGQANAATTVDEVISKLSSQQSTASEATAKQQMQQAVNHMANSTQHSESMATQMQALATTIWDLQTQVNQNQPQDRGHAEADVAADVDMADATDEAEAEETATAATIAARPHTAGPTETVLTSAATAKGRPKATSPMQVIKICKAVVRKTAIG
jgi:hypothetical protein